MVWKFPSPCRQEGWLHPSTPAKKSSTGRVGTIKSPGQIWFLHGHFLSLWYCCVDFSYCANIWRGAIMCIQNLRHLDSVGNNSRNFWVSDFCLVNIRKSQEFISVLRGFCYLITSSVRAGNNNSRLKLHLHRDSTSNRTSALGFFVSLQKNHGCFSWCWWHP